MIPALVVAAVLATSPDPSAAPSGAPAAQDSLAATPVSARVEDLDPLRRKLVKGELPEAPGKQLVLAKCSICHSTEYVTSNRLTPKQWQANVAKMRKFGAPLTDEEAAVLAEYLGQHWTPDLPEVRAKPVKPPKGALPGR